MHYHWPDVIVDAERALQMRAAMVAALKHAEWTEDELGARPVDWCATVDASVYASGLRLPGAPKATVCHHCGGKNSTHWNCMTCSNMRYLYDAAVWRLRTVLVGEAVDPDLTHHLGARATFLLKKTTVRAPEGTPLTEGYRVFDGCPPVKTKRKRGGGGCACCCAAARGARSKAPL